MKRIRKPEEYGGSSLFSYLPDEIVLQILSRLVDLKTLCRCKLVSIRFNQIVQEVDAISFTITSERDPSVYSFTCEPFVSVMKSLQTFSALKSLCIEIPSFHKSGDNRDLFKWKLFRNSSNSFLFLSPNSVCDMKENVEDEGEQEDVEVSKLKFLSAVGGVVDALYLRYKMSHYLKCFPLLENLNITEAGKRRRVSLFGGNIADQENSLSSFRFFAQLLISETENNNFNWLRWCYVPLLKLPVSGYVMKGVTLALFEMNDLPDDDDDSFTNINLNDFEDKEEAAYSEAVMVIFEINRERLFG